MSTTRPTQKSFRLCYGGRFRAGLRLLRDAGFEVDREQLRTLFMATCSGLANSLLAQIQRYFYPPSRHAMPDPIVIIGHWRSGTTLLHRLLCLDPNHTAPNSYECLFPNHFRITENRFKNHPSAPMQLWEPQEDEIALANLGLPSPYLSALFPNRTDLYYQFYALDNVQEQQRWEKPFMEFLQQVTTLRPGQLILKNPAHSFRICWIKQLFPEARFIHLTRNPVDVFCSTEKQLIAMHQSQGLHKPHFKHLHAHIFKRYNDLSHSINQARKELPTTDIIDIRYEDLAQNPQKEIQRIYSYFNLSYPEKLDTLIATFMRKNPKPKTMHRPSAAQKEEIHHRWKAQFEQWGYPQEMP